MREIKQFMFLLWLNGKNELQRDNNENSLLAIK